MLIIKMMMMKIEVMNDCKRIYILLINVLFILDLNIKDKLRIFWVNAVFIFYQQQGSCFYF